VRELAQLEVTSITPPVIEQVANLILNLPRFPVALFTTGLGMSIWCLRTVSVRMEFTEAEPAASNGPCSAGKYLAPKMTIHVSPV